MRRAAAWGEGAPQAERLERGEGPPRLKQLRVLVTGARGQLAGAIIEAYNDSAQVLAYSRAELDIADFDAVMSRVQRRRT